MKLALLGKASGLERVCDPLGVRAKPGVDQQNLEPLLTQVCQTKTQGSHLAPGQLDKSYTYMGRKLAHT